MPLVALIIVCKIKSFQKSSWNPSKILPKSTQILAKSTKIGPKSCPKSILDPKRVPKPSRTRFFRFVIDFLSLPGLPKSSQNHEKSKKKLKKSKLKNHMFFNSIFFEFSPFWPPKTKPKSKFFCYFFENVDFMKIVLPSRRNCYFSRFEPPKND